MTKKELISRKNAVTYQIRNIKEDFKHLDQEDVPPEVVDELDELMAELREIRTALGKE